MPNPTDRDRDVRERCAEIAEATLSKACDDPKCHGCLTARAIAKRIRALDLPLTSAREVTDDKCRNALAWLSDNFMNGWAKDTRHETIQAVERIAKAALASAPQPACVGVGVGEVERLRAALIPLAKQSDFYKAEVPFYEQVSVPLAYLRAAREAVLGELPSIEDILDGQPLSPAPSPQAGGEIDQDVLLTALHSETAWHEHCRGFYREKADRATAENALGEAKQHNEMANEHGRRRDSLLAALSARREG